LPDEDAVLALVSVVALQRFSSDDEFQAFLTHRTGDTSIGGIHYGND
jgi:hypothetical protein